MIREKYVIVKRSIVSTAVALVFGGLLVSVANAQQISGCVKAVQLTGLAGVKDNTKGALSVENGDLHFRHGKASTDVSAASIQDVVTGTDSRKSIGKTAGLISMAAPYGGGRFLSLFRTKIDTLTVQYRDGDGGLHGAIFTMPVGSAEAFKRELLAQGAKGEQVVPASSRTPADKEQKQ